MQKGGKLFRCGKGRYWLRDQFVGKGSADVSRSVALEMTAYAVSACNQRR